LPRIDEIIDENLLDLLAWQLHIEGYELATTIEQKISMIKNAFLLHKYKGTPYAIKQVFESLGITAELQEWFQYGGNPYMFKILLDTVISDEETYIELVKLINEYKNIRSWLESIGVHREYQNNIYVGSAFDDGKHYTVQTHLPDVNIANMNTYIGTANMISSKYRITTHLPKSVENANLYVAGAIVTSSYMQIATGGN
jgi:phage tail P2-like protein